MKDAERAKAGRQGEGAGKGRPRKGWSRNAAGNAPVLARMPSIAEGRPVTRVSFRLFGPTPPLMEEGGWSDITFEHDDGEDPREEVFDVVSAVVARRFYFDRLADEGDSAKTAKDAFFEILNRVVDKMPGEFPDRPSRYFAALEKGDGRKTAAACRDTATPYGIEIRTYFGFPQECRTGGDEWTGTNGQGRTDGRRRRDIGDGRN